MVCCSRWVIFAFNLLGLADQSSSNVSTVTVMPLRLLPEMTLPAPLAVPLACVYFLRQARVNGLAAPSLAAAAARLLACSFVPYSDDVAMAMTAEVIASIVTSEPECRKRQRSMPKRR